MDDEQTITLASGQRRGNKGRAQEQTPRELEKVQKEGISMFSETLSATVGPSYVASFFAGGIYGLVKAPPLRKHRRTTKLIVNTYINSVGKTSSKFGNNVGGAILMYIMVGKLMNFMFLEEFEEVSVPAQNAVFGGLTGALYKSTRGRRAMLLGSILGASIGSAYGSAWGRGYFRFNQGK